MNKLSIFFKGMLMGICDTIPGISGGTIAFITGIYIRLINSVNGFVELFKNILLRKKITRKNFRKLDVWFLIILLAGIFNAIFLFSKVVSYLLDNYFTWTISFFIGLILASSLIIFENIKNHKMKNYFVCFIGFIIGVLFAFIVPAKIEPGLFYVFLGGFFGISAMFLPGISGAFILLIMGLYEFILNAIHNIKDYFWYLVVFGFGAILGAMSISKLISYLFEKDKCKTLYFLLGLVIGSLSVPIKRIVNLNDSFGFEKIMLIFFFILVGILVVYFVRLFEREKTN